MSLGMWLRARFRRARVESEMERELRHHLELETEANGRRGLEPEAARRAALVAFGGVEQTKEAVRDERGGRWLEVVGADLRASIAALPRQRGFAVGAVVSLALGMSLVTSVFAVVERLFLNPLPFAHQERLVHLYINDRSDRKQLPFVSVRHFRAVRTSVRSLVGVEASQRGDFILGESGRANRIEATAITRGYLSTLGVHPLLGRDFRDDDESAGTESPLLLAYSLWQSRFGGDRDILGRSVLVNGRKRVVIGIMPDGFAFPADTRIWQLLTESDLRARDRGGNEGWSTLEAIARIAPGATTEQAESELAVIYRQSDAAVGDKRDTGVPRLISLAKHVTRSYAGMISLWIAAAIIIALLCAVNFVTMALARGMRRRGEIAVRSALGASSSRIASLLASESTVLAMIAGVISVLVAYWMLKMAQVWLHDLFGTVAIGIDWRAAVFGLGVTTMVGALCALAPAIDLSRGDLRGLISGDASGATVPQRELRSRRSLVALQVALAVASVAVVGAIVRANRAQRDRGPGYDFAPIVTADIFVADSSARPGLEHSLREMLVTSPLVQNATIVRTNSFGGYWHASQDRMTEGFLNEADVDLDYFATLGLTPIAGRLPTQAEIDAHASVIVLSTTVHKGIFPPDSAAIGRMIRLRPPETKPNTGDWFTVIGEVPDVRYGPQFTPMSSPGYTSGWMSDAQVGQRKIFLRVRGDAASAVAPLAHLMQNFDSRIIVNDVRTVASDVRTWQAQTKDLALLLGAIAGLALVLAIIGVYGLISYTSELRSRELGIRIALGASMSGLVRVLSAEVLTMGLIGVVIGAYAGQLVTSYLNSRFANPYDPQSWLSVTVPSIALSSAALLAIMILGTLVPFRRVMRADVMRVVQGQ
jgi:putative ABC transport system permease protein